MKFRHLINLSISESAQEKVFEEVKTGNPGHGYHGQFASDKADSKYAEAHKIVSGVTKAHSNKIKHYLDSVHGRHLKGFENDHTYIKKDFAKFSKRYNASLFENFQKRDFVVHMKDNKTGRISKHKMSSYSPRSLKPSFEEMGKEYGKTLHDITHEGKSVMNEEHNPMIARKRASTMIMNLLKKKRDDAHATWDQVYNSDSTFESTVITNAAMQLINSPLIPDSGE